MPDRIKRIYFFEEITILREQIARILAASCTNPNDENVSPEDVDRALALYVKAGVAPLPPERWETFCEEFTAWVSDKQAPEHNATEQSATEHNATEHDKT